MANAQFRFINTLHFRNFQGDLLGGLTAAIVALPLALAFGVSATADISTSAGAITGLYGAIGVGLFASLCGGTPSQISGPTGPMSVVMATIFTALMREDPQSGLAMAFTVVMMAGLFQILFGLLRLGKYITLMPYTVISGFMSGVGLIIITLQIAPLLGHKASSKVVSAIQQLPNVVTDINPVALGLGVLTLVIVFAAPPRLNRILPAPLIALVICTSMSVYLFPNSGIPIIGKIPAGLPEPHLPLFQIKYAKTMLGYSVMLAMLGSIDSLLTSLVADNITHTQHDSDRELIGQGIGNLVSGFLGGLPGAGATMRTVINSKSGGKTPLSGIIHALVLAIIVVGASSLTEPIPNAVLAGILIKVGIDIIDWSFLKRAHRLSLKGAGVMYLVMFLTVFVDLVTAVAVGAFLANLLTIKSLTDLQVETMRTITGPTDDQQLSKLEKEIIAKAQGKILLFFFSGPMSFGAAKSISQRLSIVKAYKVLILDLSDVTRVGITASLAIENILKDADDTGKIVFLVGVHGQVAERLHRIQSIHQLPKDCWFNRRLDALKEAAALLYVPVSQISTVDEH
ncbi:SulP family inorganic anion transporter [Acaryochloris sp. IP29b_bin.148]|uniref:SulP family inorganic anion transporter n=1 Tax=Acaryochloris sp. IP29b_bin.148 TaxID=2969218 RepID=UPI00262B762A|nr:SulP family inorganic anion transporter [Acaryochloris sp. IP29b_bin.148]